MSEKTAQPPPEDTAEAASDRVRLALIGLLAESVRTTGRGLGAARGAAGTVARFWGTLLGPLARSPLAAPLRWPYAILRERGSAELDRWVRIGRSEERRGRELLRRLALRPVDEIVGYLSTDRRTAELVRDKARELLAQLGDDPDLDLLVRRQADRYVEHLRENPEPVQEIIQGQSLGLAEQVANAVRARAVALDNRLERIARRLLGRRPRSELPASPVGFGYGGFVSRLLSLLVDLAVISAVTLAGAWAAVELLAFLGIDVRNCPEAGVALGLREWICRIAQVAAPTLSTAFVIAYWLLFWSSAGRTPGKAMLGLRIVSLDGGPPGFGAAVWRLFGYVLSTVGLGLGYAAILTDDRRRGWHDRIAGTCVVYTWEVREASLLSALTGGTADEQRTE